MLKNEKGESVTFGNDGVGKITSIGTTSLDKGTSKAHAPRCDDEEKDIQQRRFTQKGWTRPKSSRTSYQRTYHPRYESIFLGHCFYCHNFGHKVMNCQALKRDESMNKNFERIE